MVDSGIGISKVDQANIFTIFDRVINRDNSDVTRVGLAHTEKIVPPYNGTICVDIQEGVGSSFHYKLKAYL